jgi:hypothetical protein
MGVVLTIGGAGAPAALAMSPPPAFAPPPPATAPVASEAGTAALPTSERPAVGSASTPTAPADNPPGADTSATTPSLPPPAGAAVPAAAREEDQALPVAIFAAAPARPRFAMSVAVGISVDDHGIGDGRNVLVPSFAVQGGIGEGLFGFGLRLFASEAAGRFFSPNPAGGKPVADLGADRQAVDLLLTVRPFAPAWADAGDGWTARFVRALAVELGVAGERVSLGTTSTLRGGVVGGAHLSLPVVRSVDGSELFVAVVVRRMLAARQTVDIGGTPQSIGDSKLEAFSGLTVAF